MAMEANWADASGDVDFDAAVLPDLADMPDLAGMPNLATNDTPNEDRFLKKFPATGPYKVFITNLSNGTRKSDIISKLRADFDINCRVDCYSDQGYAVLTFHDRNEASKSKHLINQNFLGSRIRLLVTTREQQTFSRNSSRTTKAPVQQNRFRNLQDPRPARKITVGRGNRGARNAPRQKHNFPVGGSIRKTLPGIITERAPAKNAWGQQTPVTQSQPPRTNKRDFRSDFSARTSDRNDRDRRDPSRGDRDFQRGQGSDRRRDGFGRGGFTRQSSDRDQRRGDRRDDREDNRENKNESDRGRRGEEDDNGRADGAMNWRNRGSKPRRSAPKPDADGYLEPTKTQSTRVQRREVRQAPAKEEKRQAPKPTNKFLALMDDDDSDEE